MAEPQQTKTEPLDSRRLKLFLLIAQSGSIASAASAAGLTSSAVSHSLKTLEEELGNPLYERRGHRVILTSAGRRLIPRAEKILAEMQLIRDEQGQLREWGCGVLRIGTPASICQHILPDVLLEFRECFPDCELEVISVDSLEAHEMIREGSLDLAIAISKSESESHEPGISSKTMFQDELMVVVSPRHPWATLTRLSAEELSGQKLILYRRDSLSSKLVQRHLSKIGATKTSSLSLSSIDTIKEMAKVGLCPGVVARWVVQDELASGKLVSIPLSKKNLSRNWAALWQTSRPLGIMAQTLIGLCQDVTRAAPYQPEAPSAIKAPSAPPKSLP